MKVIPVLLLLCGMAHAQPTWLCRSDVKDALRHIRVQTENDGHEHGFRVDPDTVETSSSGQTESQVNIDIVRGKTLAVIHTHPDEALQMPSVGDRAIAKKVGIPVVVLGMRSETIYAAMPDGSVVWLSYFRSGNLSSCRNNK
jgi:hypothetical protein